MRRTTALAVLLVAATARAQYTDSVGHVYNNPNSALIGTMIQNNIRADLLRNSLFASGTAGRALARGGGAMGGPPAAFRPRPFPLETWLGRWSQGDPAKRRQSYGEWVRQKAIWDAETRARGTKQDDLGQVMATAFVLAYEAATGGRASSAGYRTMVGEFRTGFAKDAVLRGASNDRKNEIAEGAMLDATDAVMRRRAGDAAGAQAGGNRFLDRWWDERHEGAIRLLAGKGSAAAPTGDFAAAVRVTGFRRVAPSLLPDAVADPKAREIVAKLLANVRQGLQANSAGDVPVDNLARGATFALMQLHQVALSTPGKPVGVGAPYPSKAQVVALRRKVALGLAGSPDLGRMDDRDKQLMTEALYVLPAFAEAVYRTGDRAAQTKARDVARRAFQSLFGQAPETFRYGG